MDLLILFNPQNRGVRFIVRAFTNKRNGRDVISIKLVKNFEAASNISIFYE
jgi:hypothetical protein